MRVQKPSWHAAYGEGVTDEVNRARGPEFSLGPNEAWVTSVRIRPVWSQMCSCFESLLLEDNLQVIVSLRVTGKQRT